MTPNEFNPFVGPRPFERIKEDSVRFFGRTQETEEIVSLIFGHPVILVYAQSGAGKTSLFNASVAPALEENGFEVLPLTRVGGIVPRGISLKEIKNLYIFNALLKMDPETDPQSLVSKSLPATLERRLRSTDENGQPRPRVIVFDQFEELFTYTPQQWREQREGFFHQVSDALEADPLLRVVFVIREDFLAELDPYARSLPERLRTRYRLERLGETAALRAVRDPLASTSRKFAPGVAEELVQELLTMRTVDATGKTAEIKGQYVEPVQLQVVCVTLWSTLEPEVTEIQQVHLEDFDVNDALSNFYISAVESAAKETGVSETTLRNWFGRTLITPMGTRSTVFRGEERTGGVENKAVDFLESRHIIRAEFRAGARWYELTHDRLVEPILQNNQEWYKTHLSLFQRQAELWIQQGRSKGLLLSGEELEKAGEDAKKLTLTAEEKEFLEECREQQDLTRNKLEQEARERRRLRQFLAVAGSLLVLAIIAAVFAFSQSTHATKSANEAATQRVVALNGQSTAESAQAVAENAKATAQASEQKALDSAKSALAGKLTAEAESRKESDYPLALLLSMKAYGLEPTTLTRTTLFGLLQFTPSTRLYGNNEPVYSLAVSPDGKIIASSSCIGEYKKYLYGKLCSYGEIILTNAETHQMIRKIPGEHGLVRALAFKKTGEKLLLVEAECVPYDDGFNGCADEKKRLFFWDITNLTETEPVPILQLDGQYPSVNQIYFSHQGSWMFTGGYSSVELWDVRDFLARLWLLRDRYVGNRIESISCSTDDRTLVTTSGQNIRFWDISNPEVPDSVDWISDNLVEIPPLMKMEGDSVHLAAFSPDGSKFAAISGNDTITMWNWDNVTRKLDSPEILKAHNFPKSDSNDLERRIYTILPFNRDGTILASAGVDGKIILWDTSTGKQIGLPLSGHTNAVNNMVFGSLDQGTSVYLVTGSEDRSVIQWDLSNYYPPSQILTDATPSGTISNTDTNGSFTARVENDQQIMLNDQALQNGHTGTVNSLQFGTLKDSTLLLASASDDQTVILWNLAKIDTEPIFLKLDGFENPVKMAYFENGQLITVEKNSNRIIRWDIDPTTWVKRVCENIHLTDSQIKLWEDLTGEKDYQSVCPTSK